MTSNRDRAAEVIAAEWAADSPSSEHIRAARSLADAGLLAPDLPAPTRTMFPCGRVWCLEGPVGDVRATSTRKIVAFGTWQEQPFRIVATPEEARTLARTLEAAAAHAETEVTDV